MPGTTTRLQIPYPLPTDGNDVPADIKAAAERIGLVAATFASGTLGARPAAGVPGRFYKVTSGAQTGRVDYDDGSAWVTVSMLLAGRGSASTAAHSDHDHLSLVAKALFSDETLDNDNTWHAGRLDTERYDTLGVFSIPVGGFTTTGTLLLDGNYSINVFIPVAANSAGGYVQGEVQLSDGSIVGWDSLAPVPITPLALKINADFQATAGETFQVMRRASNAADVTLLQTNPRPFVVVRYHGQLS